MIGPVYLEAIIVSGLKEKYSADGRVTFSDVEEAVPVDHEPLFRENWLNIIIAKIERDLNIKVDN